MRRAVITSENFLKKKEKKLIKAYKTTATESNFLNIYDIYLG